MTPEEAKKLWAEVQANHKALDACPGPHEFVNLEPGRKLGAKHRCTTCGGTLDAINVLWYRSGLEHGRAKGGP